MPHYFGKINETFQRKEKQTKTQTKFNLLNYINNILIFSHLPLFIIDPNGAEYVHFGQCKKMYSILSNFLSTQILFKNLKQKLKLLVFEELIRWFANLIIVVTLFCFYFIEKNRNNSFISPKFFVYFIEKKIRNFSFISSWNYSWKEEKKMIKNEIKW